MTQLSINRHARSAGKISLGALFLLIAGAFVTPAFATDTACPGVAAALSSFGGTATDGCKEFNRNFINFTATSGPSNTAGTGVPTTADIDILGGGTASATTALFTAPGAVPWSLTSGGTHTEDSQFAYEMVDSPFVANLFDMKLSLGTTTITAASGNTVTVIEKFCLGVLTSAGCTASNTGIIQLVVTTANTNTTPTMTITLPTGGANCSTAAVGCIRFAAVSEAFVQTDVVLLRQNTGGGTTVSLGGLTEQFDTPEPASLMLLGSGLAGIGWLRLRRKSA